MGIRRLVSRIFFFSLVVLRLDRLADKIHVFVNGGLGWPIHDLGSARVCLATTLLAAIQRSLACNLCGDSVRDFERAISSSRRMGGRRI